jgi:nitroreductase
MSNHALFQDVIRKRRSVRKFEPGRNVDRDILRKIVDCGRWAPSGANVQCWDFIVVDDPIVRDRVMDVFLRQAQRLVDHAKGFPAVKKTYLANTAAIILVLGDPRWKVCFPQATTRCQSAFKFDPVSASNFDPFGRRFLAVALAPSALVGVAETVRARAA